VVGWRVAGGGRERERRLRKKHEKNSVLMIDDASSI